MSCQKSLDFIDVYVYGRLTTKNRDLVGLFWLRGRSQTTFTRRVNRSSTLESGINVAPGKFGKKNKRSPIYTLYLYYLNRLYEDQE